MNKLTKLLSVFAIAGAVGAGTAALAGCDSSVVKFESTAATCTTDGNVAFYASDGKYYTDEACTEEVAFEDLLTPATGHTYVYTDKGNGTHGITCSSGDLTETTEAHVDENSDGVCDKCSAEGTVGVYVEEVSSCTDSGFAAHYISVDSANFGKYYSDPICQNAVTYASLVTEATGHTCEYTASTSSATHDAYCSTCGDYEYEDCTDTNSDGKCDVCGGDLTYLTASFAQGEYVSTGTTQVYTLTIGADGAVTFVKGEGATPVTGTLSAVANGVATFESDSKTYTLTRTRGSLKLSYASGISKNWHYFVEKTEDVEETEYIDSLEDVAGVYKADAMFNVYEDIYVRLTEIDIYSDGTIVYVAMSVVGENGSVTYEGTSAIKAIETYSNVTVESNKFSLGELSFEVTADDMNGTTVKSLHVSVSGSESEAVVFTQTLKTLPTVPEEATLGAAEGSYFGTEDGKYSLTCDGENLYLNSTYYEVIPISGSAENGYLIYSYAVGNCVLKPVLTDNVVTSFGLYSVDGVTLIATLSDITVPTTKQGTYTGTAEYNYCGSSCENKISLEIDKTTLTYNDTTQYFEAELSFTSYENGVYTFVYDDDGDGFTLEFKFDESGNVVVTYDGYCFGATYTATTGSGSGESAGTTLSVGANTVTVSNSFDGNNYTFTATEAGTYTITYDSTGCVMYVTGSGDSASSEEMTSGSSYTLAAGETITLNCTMADWSTGSFTLTITKS